MDGESHFINPLRYQEYSLESRVVSHRANDLRNVQSLLAMASGDVDFLSRAHFVLIKLAYGRRKFNNREFKTQEYTPT